MKNMKNYKKYENIGKIWKKNWIKCMPSKDVQTTQKWKYKKIERNKNSMYDLVQNLKI